MIYYLATPYSHENKDIMRSRYFDSLLAQKKLMDAGIAVINPLANSVPLEEIGHKFGDEIYDIDLEILRKCDAVIVLMLDEWKESKGVTMEISEAKTLDIQVFYVREFEMTDLAMLLEKWGKHLPKKEEL